MDQKVIQEVLSVLKDIQLELRGNAEMRDVRRQLNQVIRELETAIESEHDDELLSLKVLAFIAALVAKIPAIVQAIDFLINMTKHK